MEMDNALFDDWAGFLKHWGLTKTAIILLDGARPLHILLSQFLLMGQGLIRPFISTGRLQALVNVLEVEGTSQALVEHLRKGMDQE
ncbi:MAG: hypothetical protein MUO40_08135 [Anaerolineaceae bacterium]|nr:hypothetical protein [Anaerolineaceae bacterium]